MESYWWLFAGFSVFVVLSLFSKERQREVIRIEVEKQIKAQEEKARQEEPVSIS